MKSALNAAIFLAVLFAIPLVPFLWLGESFESHLLTALREPSSPEVIAAWVFGLLAADMFLPVPSSAVITYSGGALGFVWGAIISWLGLSVGALCGFALARLFGDSIVRRFAEPDDMVRLKNLTERHGVASLVLTRAFPILAEACVLMLGAARLSWRSFVLPMLASNALLAVAYAACGQFFRDESQFPIAIVASGAIPLLAALWIRRRTARGTGS